MAEENSNAVNLDLNLGPLDNSSDGDDGLGPHPNVTMNLQDYLDNHVHREQRGRRWQSLWRQVRTPPLTRTLPLDLITGNTQQQTGEGSVGITDKFFETCSGILTNDKKDDEGSSFFDCNICLDLARNPVVTCCGHLFCWPCIYRWLHHHSDAKECPICKGEVNIESVTPIYGRGNSNTNSNSNSNNKSDAIHKIPIRPQARRVESWRQTIQRTALTVPLEEMIRRLGSAFDLRREWAQVQSGPQQESAHERTEWFLNRVMTSRGMRREQQQQQRAPLDDVAGDVGPPVRGRPDYVRAVESYLDSIPVERNEGGLLGFPLDDLDSLSSIAAVIHSESQTVDNVVEIDSFSTLSSSRRRRNEGGSRVSDVDSGDSRGTRRRRPN